MTFLEAFKHAIVGDRVRRSWWNRSALLAIDHEYRLERVPEQHHWSGPYSPDFDDIQAEDWIVEESA